MAIAPRFRILAALALATALPAAPASAQSAEAILFDGHNCSGEYRMLDRSVSDLRHMSFDNRVNSVMVITGVFEFYRDAGYGDHNGPPFRLGPSGYIDTCWSLADASGGDFPVNRMSAAQRLQATPGPAPQGVAILYDFTEFGGE